MITPRRAACVLLVAAVAIVLSGCAAIEERRQARAEARLMDAAQLCLVAGFEPRTAELRQCAITMYQQRAAQDAAASQALIQQGLQILATPPTAPPAAQICTTRWFANQWVTICQ
jgi:hypothetical protein